MVGGVLFVWFRPEKYFLEKSNPKIQNYQFRLTFGSWKFENAEFNDNLYIFCFRPETPFSRKFGVKNENC